MSTLKTIERQPFEELFEMSGGYVLDFTNTTFASFIAESTGKDIYSDRYSKYGSSKAKRLRAFWDLESDEIVGRSLNEMIELWIYKNPEPSSKEKTTLTRCRGIISRLLGKKTQSTDSELSEEQFLQYDFSNISIKKIPIESNLVPILESRFQEAVRSMKSKCPLSTIFMCGSILEGMLLGIALNNPKKFNQAISAPKDGNGKVKSFQEWSLAQFINTSCELGYLKIDIKKFSHALRDFRNYIHPFQQMSSQFNPDSHTAEICMQVLRAAVASLSGNR